MQAITQRAFGGPEVLELVEVSRPKPLPSEVLVRVHATSVNPVDTFVRSGAFPVLGNPPFTLGWDVSGVVEEVVPGVSRFRVGDEVYGMPFFPRAGNTYAQYVAVPSRQLARKPEAAGRRFAGVAVEPDYVALERLTELIEAGKIRVHVSHTLPLRDARKAHELIAKGSVQGKIVLTVD